MPLDDIIRPDLAPLKPYAPGLRVSQVRERSGKEVISKLSSNEAPLGPFPAAIEAMEAVLPRLNRYPDGGSVALRGKLAKRLGVDTEQFAVGNGSNELLRLIGQAVLRPGDEVVFGWQLRRLPDGHRAVPGQGGPGGPHGGRRLRPGCHPRN